MEIRKARLVRSGISLRSLFQDPCGCNWTCAECAMLLPFSTASQTVPSNMPTHVTLQGHHLKELLWKKKRKKTTTKQNPCASDCKLRKRPVHLKEGDPQMDPFQAKAAAFLKSRFMALENLGYGPTIFLRVLETGTQIQGTQWSAAPKGNRAPKARWPHVGLCFFEARGALSGVGFKPRSFFFFSGGRLKNTHTHRHTHTCTLLQIDLEPKNGSPPREDASNTCGFSGSMLSVACMCAAPKSYVSSLVVL